MNCVHCKFDIPADSKQWKYGLCRTCYFTSDIVKHYRSGKMPEQHVEDVQSAERAIDNDGLFFTRATRYIDGLYKRIMPPPQIMDYGLDRSVDTDKPVKILDMKDTISDGFGGVLMEAKPEFKSASSDYISVGKEGPPNPEQIEKLAEEYVKLDNWKESNKLFWRTVNRLRHVELQTAIPDS